MTEVIFWIDNYSQLMSQLITFENFGKNLIKILML